MKTERNLYYEFYDSIWKVIWKYRSVIYHVNTRVTNSFANNFPLPHTTGIVSKLCRLKDIEIL